MTPERELWACAQELIRQQYNHPAVVLWAVGNETTARQNNCDPPFDNIRPVLSELHEAADIEDSTDKAAISPGPLAPAEPHRIARFDGAARERAGLRPRRRRSSAAMPPWYAVAWCPASTSASSVGVTLPVQVGPGSPQ